MPLEKHPSMDSLYESEFDSSSTMESSVSSSSGMNKKVAPVSNWSFTWHYKTPTHCLWSSHSLLAIIIILGTSLHCPPMAYLTLTNSLQSSDLQLQVSIVLRWIESGQEPREKPTGHRFKLGTSPASSDTPTHASSLDKFRANLDDFSF